MFFAPFSEKEPGAPGAVKAPAQHRGKGETADAQSKQNGCPGPADNGEGIRNAPLSCAEDHQGRHGADDDGVQKNLHDAQQALLRRMVHPGGGVGDGCGAHARFVGEYPSGNADAQDRKECGFRMEGPFKDGPECAGDGLRPQNQHRHRQQQIDDGCKGNQHLGHFADALRPAQHHRSNKDGQDTADEQMVCREHFIQSGDHGVDLGRIAHAKGGDDTEYGIQGRQKLPSLGKAMPNHVHGAADGLSVF